MYRFKYLFLGMDKKLNRQILFRPGQPVSKVLEERANAIIKIDTTTPATKQSPILKVELSTANRSENIYKWLKSHRLINLNGLCKIVGTDRTNLMKAMAVNKELKFDLIVKIIAELKNYGYAE